MRSNANILWLPAWYPSKTDFLPGDFTHRHALAVSKHVKVTVLYVTKDPSLARNSFQVEVEHKDNLSIYRGYYHGEQTGALGKLLSVKNHLQLLWQLYRKALKEQGAFQLAHVHISLRQGLLAQWLRWRYKLPYVITEQNGAFMPVGDRYFPRSPLLQKIIRSNFKHAAALHVVSASLGKALQQRYPFISRFTVIPNVVDTDIFFPLAERSQQVVTQFFTVTSDVYHKNTDGILRAFALYLKAGNNAQLQIAGPNYEGLAQLARQLSIEHSVTFLGAIAYPAMAQKMQLADALIFFTRYETFGCVMAEAMCCGTPVIASRIPVLQENLQQDVNALFVTTEDEMELAMAMEKFSENKAVFSREAIALEAREKYHYDKVGADFLAFYKTVLPAL